MSDYIFTSERLGFRNWLDSDVEKMHQLNSDPEVMEYFPKTLTFSETEAFVKRMQGMFAERGFCYFATEVLENKYFIGFIGMYYQDFESIFTPCVDIGWRLKKSAWGKGFATEGAKATLRFAHEKVGLDTIFSMATLKNKRSIAVMEKIGMKKEGEFKHPKLADHPLLENCIYYKKRIGSGPSK